MDAFSSENAGRHIAEPGELPMVLEDIASVTEMPQFVLTFATRKTNLACLVEASLSTFRRAFKMTQEQDGKILTRTAGGDVTERFQLHLRERLARMRENAIGIGASSSYIHHLDHNVKMVLHAISSERARQAVARSESSLLPERILPGPRRTFPCLTSAQPASDRRA